MAKTQDKTFEQIVSDLSEEFQLDKKVIRYIIMNYYKNIRDIIRTADPSIPGGCLSIRIPGMGKFRVKSLNVIRKKNV